MRKGRKSHFGNKKVEKYSKMIQVLQLLRILFAKTLSACIHFLPEGYLYKDLTKFLSLFLVFNFYFYYNLQGPTENRQGE